MSKSLSKRSLLALFGLMLLGLLAFGVGCGSEPANVCNAGGCDQTCTGDCARSCPGGGCTQVCPAGASCQFTCAGGNCNQTCNDASTSCTVACAGGNCTQSCGAVGVCTCVQANCN